jgi:hypothetical protein
MLQKQPKVRYSYLFLFSPPFNKILYSAFFPLLYKEEFEGEVLTNKTASLPNYLFGVFTFTSTLSGTCTDGPEKLLPKYGSPYKKNSTAKTIRRITPKRKP